jgi:hypothetical protein
MSEENACERVGRLRGVTWTWRPDAPDGLVGEDMGVIAQEVEAVIPALVGRRPDGTLFVEYGGLVAELLAAVIELDERLADIEAPPDTAREDADAPRACALVTSVAPGAPNAQGVRELDRKRIEDVFPAAMRTNENGRRIAYHTLVAPLIEAVKELDARLSALTDARPTPGPGAGPD